MRSYYMKFEYTFAISAKNHVQAKEELLEQLQDDINNQLLDMTENINIKSFEESRV